MTYTKKTVRFAIAAFVGTACLFASENAALLKNSSLITEAQAVIGRPATPMSYAGVARRTTRRAVAVGAATAPVVVAPGAGCVQAVDAYGRVYTRCY